MNLPKLPRTLIILASLFTAYVFAALELTADELYGITQPSSKALYYFPIIGPYHLWDSWVMVFTGLGFGFFAAWILGYLYHASQPPPPPAPKTWILRTPEYYAPLPPTFQEPELPKELPQSPAEPKEPEVPRGTKAQDKPLSLQDL